MRPGERDLYLGKILQRPVHVLLFHLGVGDGEHGEDGEDEKEENVHVLLLHLGGGMVRIVSMVWIRMRRRRMCMVRVSRMKMWRRRRTGRM